MTTFSPINRAPGVYVQEERILGPIAGVGTSTAAFVGAARTGPMYTPIRLANWSDFIAAFGVADDYGPYLASPLLQVTPAVAGFFSNGGADCWFVRVGTAVRAHVDLPDRSAAANATLTVEAKADGAAANGKTIVVSDASVAATTAGRIDTTLNAASVANTNTVEVASVPDANKFAPGDWVLLDDGANTDTAQIASIAAPVLTFVAAVPNAYAAATPLRIADVPAGATTMRVDSVAHLQPGSAVVIDQGGTTEGTTVAAIDQAAKRLTFDRPLTNTYTNATADAAVDVKSQEFTLVVDGTETYANLSMDPRHTGYVLTALAASPTVAVRVPDVPNPSRPPSNQPVAGSVPLANGANDDPGAVTANDFKKGIDALNPIDEVNMLCVPDATDQDVQSYMIAHCERLKDRFAILDPLLNADRATIEAQRDNLGSDGGYGALYYPRIVISDPRPGVSGRRTLAPSGHLAGLYARVDRDRGVFKAPANEPLTGVLDLERRLDDDTQGPLNEKGINVIRRFPGRGTLVWGARTISEDTNWRYVNVRRLLEFIEESIIEGTQFVVFEPNTPALWEQVKRQVSEFLTRQWVAGALVGATAADAFQVICDAALNPPASMALGLLTVEVHLYPAPPAEFVVFRITQRPGGPEIQE